MRAHPTLAPSRALLSADRRISVSCIYAAAAGASGVCASEQRKSVPSDYIRCMVTANLRASATLADFTLRRFAIRQKLTGPVCGIAANARIMLTYVNP